MKPTKAVEILKLAISDPDMVDANDLVEAQELGIQALDKIQDLRTRYPTLMPELLPSEEPIIDTHRSLHHIKSTLESPPGRESGQ
ncbi:hypothetical protein ES705_25005 [subsurface metagenome]